MFTKKAGFPKLLQEVVVFLCMFCTGITAHEADFLYDERMFCIHPFRELLLRLWGAGILYLIIHFN